jgi:cephalosporin-C deacetylase-like acetyl esterase
MNKLISLFVVLPLLVAGPVMLAADARPDIKADAKPRSNPKLFLYVSPDRADGSYAVDEPVTWNIRITGLTANEPAPTPSYTVTMDKTEIAKGTVTFADGAAKVTCKAGKPGVLRLMVNQPTPWKSGFWCGAVAGWSEIKSTVPEPADFDAFWKKKLEELAAVPMNPVLEEVDSGSPDVQLWKITLDGFRGTRIHGYLARPKGTTPLPAQLQVQYWGVYPLKKSETVGIARKGWIAMNIMAHDLPCDRDDAFYKNPGINTYVNSGAEDPEKSYFLRMFLSCSRAVDYLAGRSDWNKGALLVQGGSQGGFQGLAAAGLNPKVTALTVFVPGGCDLTGFLEGRPSGWPGWVNSQSKGADREAKIKTAGYYDAKNFAKRIRCPVLVGTGLCDTIASPVTQFAMFNNITAPKRLVIMPADEHTDGHGAYKTIQSAWCKAAAANEPLPLK